MLLHLIFKMEQEALSLIMFILMSLIYEQTSMIELSSSMLRIWLK